MKAGDIVRIIDNKDNRAYLKTHAKEKPVLIGQNYAVESVETGCVYFKGSPLGYVFRRFEHVNLTTADRRAEQAALVAEKEALFAEVDASLKSAREVLAALEGEIAVGDKYRHKNYRDVLYTVEALGDVTVCVSYVEKGQKLLAVTRKAIIDDYWTRVIE